MMGGNFGMLSAVLDQRKGMNIRYGRMLRNGLTTSLGVLFWLWAFNQGAKTLLAFPVLFLSLALGALAAVLHMGLIKLAQRNSEESSSTSGWR